jgi:hypothetical protein
MSKQKYYPLTKKASLATENVYEAAALLLIDRVEFGLLTVEKQDGKYWIKYEVSFPESMQKEVHQAHRDYRSRKLMVNVSDLQSKIEYIIHLRRKKIEKYKLHQEGN